MIMLIKLKQKSLLIGSMKKAIILETDSDVFVAGAIKSFVKEYNGIFKQMEGSGFDFVGKLSIRCDKVNEVKGSSYIESPKWLRYKNATINKKNRW